MIWILCRNSWTVFLRTHETVAAVKKRVWIKPTCSITDAKEGSARDHIPSRSWGNDHMAMAGFSSSKNGSFFIRGKSIDDNLYLYHVVLTTKAKDRRSRGFRRSASEKLSYTAERNVLRCVLPRDPKHLAFFPTATVSCVSEKTDNLFR